MTFLEYLWRRSRAAKKQAAPTVGTTGTPAPQRRIVKPLHAAPAGTDYSPGMQPPGVPAKARAVPAPQPTAVIQTPTRPADVYDVLPAEGKRPMQLARPRDPNRVPTGAAALFSDHIHPAFRGTSLAFHTVEFLKRLRAVARSGDTSLSPHAAPNAMTRVVKGVLQGRKTVEDFYGEKVNPFKAIGAWFKKLRGDGVGSIPQHLEGYADRYNVDTADRRHRLDREVYDLIHDVHGQGDHERTDLKLRDIARRLKTATEDQKRQLTGAVRQHLQQRVKASDLPGNWHDELLNSVDRLHQYSLDRQMLKEDAQVQRRSRIVGPEPKQPGQIGWKEWFLGAKGLVGKRQDPLRLSREHAPQMIANVLGDHPDEAPILADVLEENKLHYDDETLHHLRTEPASGKFSIHTHPTTGLVWARHTPEHMVHVMSTDHGSPASDVQLHAAHGPGGIHVVTRAIDPASIAHYVGRLHDTEVHRRPTQPYRVGHKVGDLQIVYTPEIARNLADRRAATFPEAEPVRLNRLSSGLAHALRELASKNQQARESAARKLLTESGEQGSVTSVLAHHPELGFRPSVLAALSVGDDYAREASRYLGAWHGMITQEPETVAFHEHEGGQDRLHVLHTAAQPEEATRVLQAHGFSRFALRPHAAGSTVFVYDRGGLHDLTPLARSLPNGSANFSTGTGQRLGQGAGADAGSGTGSAAAYRDHIRAVESPTPASPERVHLARLKPGAIRAADMKVWQAVVAKMPEDRVRRGAFADWLEEKGHHHSEDDLKRLREHEGPLFVVRHPVSKKVVAVPGSPESVESLNERRLAHGLGPIYSDRTKLFHGPAGVTAVHRIAGAEPNDATVGILDDPETGGFDWDREWTTPREAHHVAQQRAFGD